MSSGVASVEVGQRGRREEGERGGEKLGRKEGGNKKQVMTLFTVLTEGDSRERGERVK